MAVYLVEGARSEVEFEIGDCFELLTEEDAEEFPKLSFEYDVYEAYGFREFHVAVPKGFTRQDFVREFSDKVSYKFSVKDLYSDDNDETQEESSDEICLYKIPLKRFILSDDKSYYYADYRKSPLLRVGDPTYRIFLSSDKVCARQGYLFVECDYLDRVLERKDTRLDDVFSHRLEVRSVSRDNWYRKFKGK